MSKKYKKAEILLSYARLIEMPPVSPAQLHGQACQNDGVTINAWRETWVNNIKANAERFGNFKENGIGQLFGSFSHLPCVVAGSGPSLKNNAHLLKDRKKEMKLVSCLHNFHYFEDRDVEVDFYVTLDSGKIVIDEVSEGGQHDKDWYWERSKGKKLLAFAGTDPSLFDKWQGEVYFFNCPIADEEVSKISEEIGFHTYVGTGGNVLGACTYIAKAIFGANPVIFIGADFSFANYNTEKPMFHAWDSSYDADIGRTIPMIDIYGNRVLSWPSYANFKAWFDYIISVVPGLWINCTEGGTLGAYSDGVLMKCPPMDLSDCLRMYEMYEEIREQCENPATSVKKLLF
jgi:hypothetical protein